MTDASSLVRKIDIAEIAGVTPGAVSNWLTRDVGFPEPVVRFGHGRRTNELFDLGQVLKWLESTGRLP